MDEDLFRLPDAEPPLDLGTGDGTYRRKPRLHTGERPVPVAMVIVAALCTAAAIVIGAGWYATDAERDTVTPRPLLAQPVEVPSIVFDTPVNGPAYGPPLCEYRTPDLQSFVELPAAVDDAALAGRKLVLQTDHGRITVRLNGWAGKCAIRSIVSQTTAHRFDGVRCLPIQRAKALRCTRSIEYVYPPQLIDLTTVVENAQTTIDENGVLHIVPGKAAEPKPVAVGKRAGLLTIVANADGYAAGDLVLIHADTTLPAGAFYPTVGEVDEGAELFGKLGAGMTITSAAIE